MKHKMDPPAKHGGILRLTPTLRRSVSPPTPPSLIITLRIPRKLTAHKTPTIPPRRPSSLRDLAVQHAALRSAGGRNRVVFAKPSGDSSTDTSPERPHNKHDLSSPSSTSSASTVTPDPETLAVVPEYILLDNRRKAAAVETVGIFFKWGREEIIQELNEAIQMQNNAEGSVQAKLITKKMWVRESLRSRYNIYIQTYSEHPVEGYRALRGATVAKGEPGSECEYPGCGKQFSSGEYRVAFEPPGWSISTVRKASTQTTVDLTGTDSEDDGEGDTKPKILEPTADPVTLLPDYHKLLTPRAIAEYGRGEFYCVKCFEKLLESGDNEVPAPSRTAKRKRVTEKWARPSPLCRIYSSVFAEIRKSLEGRYELDDDAHDIVRRWKDAVFDQKTRLLMAKFGGLILKIRGQEEILEVKKEDEGLACVQVDGGRGLAECLAALKVKDTKVFRGKKKVKY